MHRTPQKTCSTELNSVKNYVKLGKLVNHANLCIGPLQNLSLPKNVCPPKEKAFNCFLTYLQTLMAWPKFARPDADTEQTNILTETNSWSYAKVFGEQTDFEGQKSIRELLSVLITRAKKN